jgi:hypothetical protein
MPRKNINHIFDREYIELICYIMAMQSNLVGAAKLRYGGKAKKALILPI